MHGPTDLKGSGGEDGGLRRGKTCKGMLNFKKVLLGASYIRDGGRKRGKGC